MSLASALGITSETHSKALSQALTSISNDIGTKISTSNSAFNNLQNTINLTGTGAGSVLEIGDIEQENVSEMKTSVASDSDTNTQIQNDVLNKIQQTAESKGFPGPMNVSAETQSDIKNIISTNVNVEKITSSVTQAQLKNAVNVSGYEKAKINSIRQKNTSKLYADAYSKSVDTMVGKTAVTNDVTQEAKASSNFIADIIGELGNLLAGLQGIMAVAVIALIFLAIGLFAYFAHEIMNTPAFKWGLLVLFFVAFILAVLYALGIIGNPIDEVKKNQAARKQGFAAWRKYVQHMHKRHIAQFKGTYIYHNM